MALTHEAVFFVALAFLLTTLLSTRHVAADPETVDGLYLTKKNDAAPAAPNSAATPATAWRQGQHGGLPNNNIHSRVDANVKSQAGPAGFAGPRQPQHLHGSGRHHHHHHHQTQASSPGNGHYRPFQQGYVGGIGGHARPKAFKNYISSPPPPPPPPPPPQQQLRPQQQQPPPQTSTFHQQRPQQQPPRGAYWYSAPQPQPFHFQPNQQQQQQQQQQRLNFHDNAFRSGPKAVASASKQLGLKVPLPKAFPWRATGLASSITTPILVDKAAAAKVANSRLDAAMSTSPSTIALGSAPKLQMQQQNGTIVAAPVAGRTGESMGDNRNYAGHRHEQRTKTTSRTQTETKTPASRRPDAKYSQTPLEKGLSPDETPSLGPAAATNAYSIPNLPTPQPQKQAEVVKKDEGSPSAEKKTIQPRAGFLKGTPAFEPASANVKGDDGDGGSSGNRGDQPFAGQDRQKAILGLMIGVAFVVVFVAISIGLATQCILERARVLHSTDRMFSDVRTPNEEDRTPPELRGSSQPAFVQPDEKMGGGLRGGPGANAGNGEHKPFYGKLMLYDPPNGMKSCHRSVGSSVHASGALATNVGHAAAAYMVGTTTSMTSTLLAAQAAVMMPSPAEQVTDDLVSPKYDTEDDDDDEDDSDDTVYECPGLAAPGEMVVSNPFYLQGADVGVSPLEGDAEPKPISQSSIFHHGIKGFN